MLRPRHRQWTISMGSSSARYCKSSPSYGWCICTYGRWTVPPSESSSVTNTSYERKNSWGTSVIFYFIYLYFFLFCVYVPLHVQRLLAALPRYLSSTWSCWHLECCLLDCVNYISSSFVIEIPVSSARCVNVIQRLFYSNEEKKQTILSECSLCIKPFGSYIWLFIYVLLLNVLELRVDFTNAGGDVGTFFADARGLFLDDQLCYPKQWDTRQIVAWR